MLHLPSLLLEFTEVQALYGLRDFYGEAAKDSTDTHFHRRCPGLEFEVLTAGLACLLVCDVGNQVAHGCFEHFHARGDLSGPKRTAKRSVPCPADARIFFARH